jgi:hypothetical protein
MGSGQSRSIACQQDRIGGFVALTLAGSACQARQVTAAEERGSKKSRSRLKRDLPLTGSDAVDVPCFWSGTVPPAFLLRDEH